MAIGARSYRIVYRVWPTLREVHDVVYFEKWIAIGLDERGGLPARLTTALRSVQHVGTYRRVAEVGKRSGFLLLRLVHAAWRLAYPSA